MSSLRRNLEWLFALLFLAGTALLAWGLMAQWQIIVERHQLRQRSQVDTIAGALHAILDSQETVLSMLGGQLAMHYQAGRQQAAEAALERMLAIDQSAIAYGMLDADGRPLMLRFQPPLGQVHGLAGRLVAAAGCAADNRNVMHVGRPFQVESNSQWVVPLCTAVRDREGRIRAYMIGALSRGGKGSFFDEVAALGPTNIVQVVREVDLQPILWATSLDLPADRLAQPVSPKDYQRAIASAEALSGDSFEQIRASGRPYRYRLTTSLGVQIGMAVYDPRYRFWVLTQTSRSELVAELWRTGRVYGVIYLAAVVSLIVLLVAIAWTERRRLAELVYQASHDGLTGLPNRQSMAASFVLMQRRHGSGFSLLFIDMDNFKAVNDGFGHLRGDALLVQVGHRLQAFATGEEHLARVGGDEFVLLTAEVDAQRLQDQARSLIATLTRRYELDGSGFELGCSIGIARMTDAGATLNDALRAADVALRSAKRQRNAACLFEPAMGRVYLENIRIEQRLRVAIEEEKIYMAYHPVVDAHERIVGVEALARWDDEELGAVPPERFIPIAETAGLIGRLGEFVISRCLADARRLEREGAGALRLSVNASVRQFQQTDFASNLISQVGAAGLVRITPVLEITENLFVEDQGSIHKNLEAIRAAGIRISLDDFGTGYSSLSMLLSLPIDELKIDKRFVDQIDAGNGSHALIDAIVSIGHSHGLAVIAEGIETRREFDLLREAGCDAFQGFLFARPMPLDEFIAGLQASG